jgi:hypothetical protein
MVRGSGSEAGSIGNWRKDRREQLFQRMVVLRAKGILTQMDANERPGCGRKQVRGQTSALGRALETKRRKWRFIYGSIFGCMAGDTGI